MKTIKIRFINYNNQRYTAQRKTWFGWRDISYTSSAGEYTSIVIYTSTQKDTLLTIILDNYYQRDKRFTKVVEYPEIKKY